MTQYVDPVHLRQILTQYYNDGELRTMCFDLGIDYESLGGRGKSEKVAELVLYARRQNRINDIAAYVRQTRQFIQLRMTDTPSSSLGEVAGSRSSSTHDIHVHGDMVGGDKVSGDKITVGDISGSSGIAIGRGAQAIGGSVHTGDRIDMSGDFRGANVNVKSTLTNATQTIGAMPHADDTAKAELQRLLAELKKTLIHVPPDNAQEKQAVEQMVEMLVNAAEQANKPMMQISAEGLKKAAENLAAVVPNVVKIAGAIVDGILGLG